MSRYIKVDDIRDAIIDLNDKVFLDKRMLLPVLKAIVGLPTIDIVYCKECIWRDKDNQDEDYCTYVKGLADINGESFCSYGERIDK